MKCLPLGITALAFSSSGEHFPTPRLPRRTSLLILGSVASLVAAGTKANGPWSGEPLEVNTGGTPPAPLGLPTCPFPPLAWCKANPKDPPTSQRSEPTPRVRKATGPTPLFAISSWARGVDEDTPLPTSPAPGSSASSPQSTEPYLPSPWGGGLSLLIPLGSCQRPRLLAPDPGAIHQPLKSAPPKTVTPGFSPLS